MNIDQIKTFIKLAKDEGVQELNYEAKDVKISVSFATGGGAPAPVHYQTQQIATQTSAPFESRAATKSQYHEIKSPFVGTYYGSASPEEPAFVKVGDKVKKGQILCILEAMKIMNEIECDTNGEIVECCLENENLVEFGQVIFRVKT